jgi:hypothetical protein
MIKASIDRESPVALRPMKYPYVGESEHGNVVMFTAPCTGLLLVTKNEKIQPVGLFLRCWDEATFQLVTRRIIVENML